jgi:para-nitrobenzyl esterase
MKLSKLATAVVSSVLASALVATVHANASHAAKQQPKPSPAAQAKPQPTPPSAKPQPQPTPPPQAKPQPHPNLPPHAHPHPHPNPPHAHPHPHPTPPPHANPQPKQLEVATQYGPVIGSADDGMRQFLGIPYAAPPVGNLRWKAPQPPAKWSKPRLAQQFGSSCPQFGSPFGLESFDEDCLYLNVYTPDKKNAQHLPVMVWFHPGAYQFGEADDYDPRRLVKRGVVVVTVNYRLGALGFLAHPALTKEAKPRTSGNYGLMDQQAALRWVKNNIAKFGGDPNNVTIFGDSAGGLSVHVHLVSPESQGLFHRAIIQSGAYSLQQPTLAEAEQTGIAFADATGCTTQTAACLRALPVAAVLANQIPGALGFLPNVDNHILPRTIGDALAAGKFQRVPVMQGATRDEFRLFIPLSFDFVSGPATPEIYTFAISALVGTTLDHAAAIAREYPLENYPDTNTALAAIGTDAVFACNMLKSSQHLARYVPTYVYEFNDRTAPQRYLPPASMPYGAAHEAELQYLFDIVTNMPPIPLNEQQSALAEEMVTAWTNFARTGSPNLGSKPNSNTWLPAQSGFVRRWDSSGPASYSLSEYSNDHRCEFWRD